MVDKVSASHIVKMYEDFPSLVREVFEIEEKIQSRQIQLTKTEKEDLDNVKLRYWGAIASISDEYAWVESDKSHDRDYDEGYMNYCWQKKAELDAFFCLDYLKVVGKYRGHPQQPSKGVERADKDMSKVIGKPPRAPPGGVLRSDANMKFMK